jgi:hypothetical protein
LKLPWKSTHHWSCWNKEAREKDIRHQVLITDTFGHNGPTAIFLKEVWRRVGYTDKFLEVKSRENGYRVLHNDRQCVYDGCVMDRNIT